MVGMGSAAQGHVRPQGALIEEAIVQGSVFAAENLLGEVVLGVRELEGHDVVGAQDEVAVGGHGGVYTRTPVCVSTKPSAVSRQPLADS